jgi:hypothetical protein
MRGRAESALTFSHTRQSVRQTQKPGSASQTAGKNAGEQQRQQRARGSDIGDGGGDGISRNSGSNAQRPNTPYGRDVYCARFYYLDKLVAVSSGGSIFLYRYSIDASLSDRRQKDDLNRLQNNSRYMLAHRWSLPAQAVTSISCVNCALSHLLVCAASDRSIVVLDAAHGTIARTIEKVTVCL